MDINNNNNILTDQINELYNSYKNSIKEQFELISEQQNKILLDLDEFYKKSLNLIINNKKNKNFKKNLSLNINNENNMIEKHIISKTPKNFYNSNNNLYKSNSTNKTINFKSPSKQNNTILNNNSTIYNKSKFYSNMNTINKNDKNIKNKSSFYNKNLLIQDKSNKKVIERSISMLLKTNKDYTSKHNKNNSNFISNNKSKNNIINSKKNFNKSNNRKSFEKNNFNNKNNNNNNININNNKVSNINLNKLKKFSIFDIPNEINTNLKRCFYLMSKNNIVPFNIRLKFIMNIKPIYNYYNINDISNDYFNFLQNKISNLNQINKNLFFKPSKLAQINLNFLNKKNENDFYNNNNIKNEDKKIVMLFIKIILNIEQINIEKFNDFKVTLLKLKEICKNNLKHFLLNSETIKKINNINENNLLKMFLFITNNNNNIIEIEFNKINNISPVLNYIFFYIKELISFLINRYKINESINNVNNELLKYKKKFENI